MDYTRQSGVIPRKAPPIRSPYYGSAGPQQQQNTSLHSRTRTTSSNVFPIVPPTAVSKAGAPSPPTSYTFNPTRRLSTATTSTSSTGNAGGYTNNRAGSINSTMRRSGSGRSNTTTGSPTSYVALMRKQKATVWCDRAQHEDPRTAAAAKAAKARATMEVHGRGKGGGSGSGRSSTAGSGSMVGKIRHHGIPKAPGYVSTNLSGAGVPLRLSANEVGNQDDDLQDDASSTGQRFHQRTGSGRSSQGSARFPSGYQRPQAGRFSSGSTPPSEQADSINEEPEETPVPQTNRGSDYFNAPPHQQQQWQQAGSVGLEREDSFGSIKEMAGPNAALTAAEKAKKAEDLRRRGSVDERTMTMSGVRLFVANPDMDD